MSISVVENTIRMSIEMPYLIGIVILVVIIMLVRKRK